MHACLSECVCVELSVYLFVIWWQWWCDYQLAALAASCDHANSTSSNKCWKIYRKLYRLLSAAGGGRFFFFLCIWFPFPPIETCSNLTFSYEHHYLWSLRACVCMCVCLHRVCHLLIDAHTFKYYIFAQFVFISINVWFALRSSVKHIHTHPMPCHALHTHIRLARTSLLFNTNPLFWQIIWPTQM